MVELKHDAVAIAQEIVTELKRAGWQNAAIKAVIANAAFESALDPTTQNDIGASGLWQYYPQPDWLVLSWEKQYVEAQIHNMRDGEKWISWLAPYAWDGFKNNTDPESATWDFLRFFENPGEPESNINRWTTPTSSWRGHNVLQSPEEAFTTGILANLEWGSNSASGGSKQRVEVIVWPWRDTVTQGEVPFDEFSHGNEAAFDILGGDGQPTEANKVLLTAPFTGISIPFNDSFGSRALLSKYPLKWVDGSIQYGLVWTVHSEDPQTPLGTIINKGQTWHHTGALNANGINHSHIIFAKVNKNNLQTASDVGSILQPLPLATAEHPGGGMSIHGFGGGGNVKPFVGRHQITNDIAENTFAWVAANDAISMTKNDFDKFKNHGDFWHITGFKDTNAGDVDGTDPTDMGDDWTFEEQGTITSIFDGYKTWRGF